MIYFFLLDQIQREKGSMVEHTEPIGFLHGEFDRSDLLERIDLAASIALEMLEQFSKKVRRFQRPRVQHSARQGQRLIVHIAMNDDQLTLACQRPTTLMNQR